MKIQVRLLLAGLVAAVIPASAYAGTLEDLLVEKGVITRAEASGAKSSMAAPAKVYYKSGTNLEFPDSGFKTTIKTYVQTRYTYTDNDTELTGDVDKSSFDVAQARLEVGGTALHEEFSYRVQGDFASFGSDRANEAKLADAYLAWHACDWAEIKMGQFKSQASRQGYMSDSTLQLADRSVATNYFYLGRHQGMRVGGEFADGVVKAGIGIFNGNSEGEGANLPGVDTRHAGVLDARVNLMGKMSPGEGDVDNTQDMAADLGASYAVSSDRATGATESLDTSVVSVDANLKSSGFALHGELFVGDEDLGGDEDAKPVGAYVQAGYFFVPEKWEVAARWGIIDCDDGLATGDCSGLEDINEATAGINYYWLKHNLKTGFNFVHVSEDPLGDGSDDAKTNRWLLNVAAAM